MLPKKFSTARLIIVATACLVLAGCQLWPFNQQDSAPQPPPRESAPAESSSSAEAPPVDSVERAMSLLQDGSEDRAESMLVSVIEKQPEEATARLLLAQIRQPPEELLGEDYEEIRVEPGDSLSAIAGRTMNNELLFYALARLNGVEVPRLLRSGQRLKVPRIEEPEPAEVAIESPAETTDRPAEVAEESAGNNLELSGTARQLIERERPSQAFALLLSAARAGKLESSSRDLLSDAAVQLARVACEGDDPERANKILNQAAPWLGAAADRGEFADQRRHIEARLLLSDAEKRLGEGDHDGAFDALMSARGLVDDLSGTHGEREARVVDALGLHYHDRALSAWRDQEVDESVALWERVVRIDPAFEPAIRYLDRARRIRRELDDLKGD